MSYRGGIALLLAAMLLSVSASAQQAPMTPAEASFNAGSGLAMPAGDPPAGK